MTRSWPWLLALLATSQTFANDLTKFYEMALLHDTTLQAAHFQHDALIEARPQAIAQWLPQVNLSAGVERERMSFNSGPAQGSTAVDCAVSSTVDTQRCYGTSRSLGVTLSQTLWSFQSFSALREANSAVAAAESSYQGAQQSLLLRVSQAYFAILSAKDQLAANRNERDAFQTLLNQARVRQQTGVGPRSDVEQAQAFFDATEQNVIDAENALDDANLALSEIIGEKVSMVAPLRDDIPLKSPEPATVDEWVSSAREDNFDVRTAMLKMDAAERDIGVQRGRGLPSLQLTGTASKLNQDPVLGGDQRLDTIGISFVWPIFQGGGIASAVRQSRALYHQAEANYDSAQRDAERQTRAAFRGVVSGIQRIGASHRAVDSGKQAVEASRRNVEFGTGTEFELLDAQNNYFAAVRAYAQARYDYLTNVLTLKQQAGRLTVRDLAAIDDLLILSST
jgi:outer membrane protein